MTAELRLGLGGEVNHKRVERLMREQGLQGVTRRRRSKGCTRTRDTDPRSDDLVHRQFRPEGPDRLWVQDVTQHRTSEGWVYLAVAESAAALDLANFYSLGYRGLSMNSVHPTATVLNPIRSIEARVWLTTAGYVGRGGAAMWIAYEVFRTMSEPQPRED